MAGGTTFTFVTDGIESALDQAREAAGDRDVAIAGGASTINQRRLPTKTHPSGEPRHRSPTYEMFAWLKELMAPDRALQHSGRDIYQHATRDRDHAIAALNALIEETKSKITV